jgi:hypothetical protein
MYIFNVSPRDDNFDFLIKLLLLLLLLLLLQRKFANLRYNRFIQPNCLRNYKLILNYLHLKTLYSTPRRSVSCQCFQEQN